MLPSQGAQQSAPEDLPSDDSSDPNGHDLGFLSLPHDSVPYMYDADGTSSKESCAQRKPSVMQDSSGAHGGMRQQSHAGSGCSADGCDELGGAGRRRRGRPVGSKDRQPRVKRMAFSPQPSDNGDKNSVGESEARRKPWKIILTAEQAVEIYKKRSIGANMDSTSSCRSNEVAEQYGVNSKTIRDIWNRATWVKATRSEWNEQEEAMYMASQANSNSTPTEGDAAQPGAEADKGSGAQKRTRGRPKGSRDLRPRVKRKSDSCFEGDGEASEWPGIPSHLQLAANVKTPGMMLGTMHAGDALNLQSLLVQPSATMPRSMTHKKGAHQSSSNTSHSQSSSYTNDDSHSGDHGSDSGGSGSGSGNSPPHAPASPTSGMLQLASQQAISMAGGAGLAMAGGMPTLHAFNRYANVPGLRSMDDGRMMQAHAWSASGFQEPSPHAAAVSATHVVAASIGSQDLKVHPTHGPPAACAPGHAGEGLAWGVAQHHLAAQPRQHVQGLSLPLSMANQGFAGDFVTKDFVMGMHGTQHRMLASQERIYSNPNDWDKSRSSDDGQL